MSRKEKTVTITAEGRDRGKAFFLTEMPADQGERWAFRTLLALSRGGIDLPPGIFDGGFAGLSTMLPYFLVIGLKSLHGAQWAEVEPLLDEMMLCVQWKPPGGAPLQPLFPGVNCQIEEVATRVKLRQEVLQLHVNFSVADSLSTSGQDPPAPASS